MVLQLDLAPRIDPLGPVPNIFHHHLVGHQLAVELHRDPLADHLDVESVPLAHRQIRLHQGKTGMDLVVPQRSRALVVTVPAVLLELRIPDLNLGAAAQVDAAVAAFQDLPIDIQLEVAVVPGGAQAVSLAVELQNAVDHSPVGTHALISLLLGLRQLGRRHRSTLDRVFHQPLPTGQGLPVE